MKREAKQMVLETGMVILYRLTDEPFDEDDREMYHEMNTEEEPTEEEWERIFNCVEAKKTFSWMEINNFEVAFFPVVPSDVWFRCESVEDELVVYGGFLEDYYLFVANLDERTGNPVVDTFLSQKSNDKDFLEVSGVRGIFEGWKTMLENYYE